MKKHLAGILKPEETTGSGLEYSSNVSKTLREKAFDNNRPTKRGLLENLLGWVMVSLDNPHEASWSIWAMSKVDFRVEVLSNSIGCMFSIYPSFITV